MGQTGRKMQSRKQGRPRRAQRLPSSQPGPEGDGQLGSGLDADAQVTITQLTHLAILTSGELP